MLSFDIETDPKGERLLAISMYELARGALYTGLRHGELLSILVSDIADGQVLVRHSKTGKSRSVPLSAEGEEFFSRMTSGKSGGL
ncbi:MAG: tyrosine-type recombinase/integrase [Gammaproteobacteria bacterium]